MRYGTPYKGSKNQIAKQIVEQLPEAECLVDLFAGGCAITHAAMLSGKYKRFIANDISTAPKLFKDAVDGKYAKEKRWISREDFFRLKDSDDYVKYCWSFGNNGKDYMYAKELEPWKKALHYARVLQDYSLLQDMNIESDGSRIDVKSHNEEYKAKYIHWWLSKQEYSPQELDLQVHSRKEDIQRASEKPRQYFNAGLKASGLTQAKVKQSLQRLQGLHSLESLQSLGHLERLQRLQSLERLQSLQNLENLENAQSLEIIQSDYKAVRIPENSVVYCDIPYKGTKPYDKGIQYEEFYDWCCRQTVPVIISEYWMPEDRFVAVWEKSRQSTMREGNAQRVVEKLFRPRNQI